IGAARLCPTGSDGDDVVLARGAPTPYLRARQPRVRRLLVRGAAPEERHPLLGLRDSRGQRAQPPTPLRAAATLRSSAAACAFPRSTPASAAGSPAFPRSSSAR